MEPASGNGGVAGGHPSGHQAPIQQRQAKKQLQHVHEQEKHNRLQHEHEHDGHDHPATLPAYRSLTQTMPELEFERGLWPVALRGDCARAETMLTQRPQLLDARDSAGYTPLHYAARAGKNEMCRLLIQKGADVNAQTRSGATALHRAAMSGQRDTVRLLLQFTGGGGGSHGNGGRLDAAVRDGDGRTAAERARAEGHTAIAELIEQCVTTTRLDTRARDRES